MTYLKSVRQITIVLGLFIALTCAHTSFAALQCHTFYQLARTDLAQQPVVVKKLQTIAHWIRNKYKLQQELGLKVPTGILIEVPQDMDGMAIAQLFAQEAGATFNKLGLQNNHHHHNHNENCEHYQSENLIDKHMQSFTIHAINLDKYNIIDPMKIDDYQLRAQAQELLSQNIKTCKSLLKNNKSMIIGITQNIRNIPIELKKPGLLSHSIHIAPLSLEARKIILKQIIALLPKVHRPNTENLANITRGYSRKKLEYMVEEAVRIAAQEQSNMVKPDHFKKAVTNTNKTFDTLEKVYFKDIAGQDAAIKEIQTIVKYLKNPKPYEKLNASMPRGLLLEGPPGNGKTLLARAIATETNASFFSASASEFITGWVGDGSRHVRDLFSKARSCRPAIIFIDEIDTIGGKRSQMGGSRGDTEYTSTLNELLCQMDGFEKNDHVVVIGATNMAENLDPALVRAGRIDRKITIGPPAEDGRKSILHLYLNKHPLARSIDKNHLAQITNGFSGAQLKNLVNEAAIIATEKGQTHLEQADCLQAFRKIKLGINRAGLSGTIAARTTFSDVAGQDEVIKELKTIVQFLKNGSQYQKMNARIPRGVLMQGPPGTGKTLLARAIAGEADCSFFSVSGSEIIDGILGDGAKHIRNIFIKAQKSQSAIIFFDEIDTIGSSRAKLGCEELRNTLNELLAQMDGFEQTSNVIVIGATNMAHDLDPALTRPGRFDRIVEVGLPSKQGRIDILGLHFRQKPGAAKLNYENLALITTGWSGAELANLANEAAIIACEAKALSITDRHCTEAWDKICLGLKHDHTQSKKTLQKTAYHESGHTLISILNNIPVHKVTIIGRGQTGGHMVHLEDFEKTWQATKNDLKKHIMVSLGGFIAEKLIYGQSSPGCSSDLKKAYNTAYNMVSKWGMGENELEAIALIDELTHSDHIKTQFAKQAQNIVRECAKETEKLLLKHKPALEKLTRALIDKEILTQQDIMNILREYGN